jgi:HEAT repeat protein
MSFIAGIVKRFRRLASGLKEKPTVQLEDFEFEHFLLYHGLVGSTPENERSFRDVRADINAAVQNNSPTQLAIAFKLPPLWWDDKLETIFLEMSATTGNTGIGCLLPQSSEQLPVDDARPLRHSDWRVRSNAARVAAALNVTEALPEIVLALNDEAPERRAAFCHLACSLGRLGRDESRQALKPFLYHEESWYRVDAAGALAHFNSATVAHDLMSAMLDNHRLSDYMAVAIARKHKPKMFIEHADTAVQDGGVEMVIALLQAACTTFPAETAHELGVVHLLPQLCELAKDKPTPRRLRAVMELSKFLTDNDQISTGERDKSLALLEQSVSKAVSEWLSKADEKKATAACRSEILHALWLAGEEAQTEVLPYVIPMLKTNNPWLRPAIETAGKLGDPRVALHLVPLAEELVKPASRAELEISKQPVFEENEESAKAYWQILRALGALPCHETARLLLIATADFTPDKRAEALSSLNKVLADPTLHGHREAFQKAVSERLSDPAAQVRIAALDAAGTHKFIDLLPTVMRMVEAKEVSVYKQAMSTLEQFGQANAARVKEAIRGRATQVDRFKRERYDAVLEKLPPS